MVDGGNPVCSSGLSAGLLDVLGVPRVRGATQRCANICSALAGAPLPSSACHRLPPSSFSLQTSILHYKRSGVLPDWRGPLLQEAPGGGPSTATAAFPRHSPAASLLRPPLPEGGRRKVPEPCGRVPALRSDGLGRQPPSLAAVHWSRQVFVGPVSGFF